MHLKQNPPGLGFLPSARLVFTGAVTGLLLLLLFAILAHREPTYRSRTVSGWLSQSAISGNGNDKEVHEAFRKLGSKAVPVEIKALTRTDSPLDRWYRVNYPKLPAWLQGLFPEPVEAFKLRLAAQLALHSNEHTGEHIEKLLPLTKHADSSVRSAAASLVAVHFQPENTLILPSIVEFFGNPDPYVRSQIARALEKCKGPGASRIALPALHKALQDTSAQVRISAAGSLAMIDSNAVPSAVQVLREAITHGDLEARVYAANVILYKFDSGSPEALRTLVNALTSRDAALRSADLRARSSAQVTLKLAESWVFLLARRNTNITALLSGMASEDSDPAIQKAARKALDQISRDAVP